MEASSCDVEKHAASDLTPGEHAELTMILLLLLIIIITIIIITSSDNNINNDHTPQRSGTRADDTGVREQTQLFVLEPSPCGPAAETALQPLIWCFESVSCSKGCSSQEECFFSQTPVCWFLVILLVCFAGTLGFTCVFLCMFGVLLRWVCLCSEVLVHAKIKAVALTCIA